MDFVNKIHNVKFNSSDVIVSFDVESLFTNVPLLETINLICDYVYDKNNTDIPSIPVKNFKKLLTKSVEGIFMYNSRYYQQIDGVSMGNPLGPTFANIFLAHLEKQFMSHSFSSLSYSRYIDDILCVFSSEVHCNKFLDMINTIHPNLKFTVEKSNNGIPFLVTLVEVDSNSVCHTSVYRKPAFTSLILNFDSLCPITFKISILMGYLHRAFCICSSWSLFHLEIENIIKIFSSNGYPSEFIYKYVNRFVSSKFCKPKVSVQSDFDNCISIPYYGHCSIILRHNLRKLFKSINVNVNLCFSTTKLSNYLCLKDKTPLSLVSGVVYSFSCQDDPDITYIGKTKRHLYKRVKEHRDPSSLSGISNHLLSCNSNCIDSFSCSNFKILNSCNSDLTLQIMEALCIKKLKPSLNSALNNNGSSYFLKLF